MQTEDIIISRVLLEGYRHLDRLYEALGKSIDCLVSNGYNSGYRGTTCLIYERIINYTYRRAGIYNLKALVNLTLQELTARSREILTLHFIEQKEFAEIKDLLGVSLRTVFRYYDKALQSFALNLTKIGFPESRLEEEYKDEPFYIRMKKYVLENQKTNVERGKRKEKDDTCEVQTEIADETKKQTIQVKEARAGKIIKGDVQSGAAAN